jgi:hypothetical protein
MSKRNRITTYAQAMKRNKLLETVLKYVKAEGLPKSEAVPKLKLMNQLVDLVLTDTSIVIGDQAVDLVLKQAVASNPIPSADVLRREIYAALGKELS